jgi:hypothetical protein
MVMKAREARKSREWSSRKLRISSWRPSPRCQAVASTCQISLGSLASKRMNELRGRLWGWGVIRPWRLRIRQTVEAEGSPSTRSAR